MLNLFILVMGIAAWIGGELRQLRALRVAGVITVLAVALYAGFTGGTSVAHEQLRTARVERQALLEMSRSLSNGMDCSHVQTALKYYEDGVGRGGDSADLAVELVQRLRSTPGAKQVNR